MMDYDVFREIVMKKFKDYLPEEYQGMDIQAGPVQKVNRTLDGIYLTGGKEGRNVSPTIYINDLYGRYAACNDLESVLQAAATKMVQTFLEIPECLQLDTASAEKQIVFQLINTEQNRKMLENMPHREFQDLSIIYRWVVRINAVGFHSVRVDHALAKRIGLSEEQLFSHAVENTRKLLPPCIKSINEELHDIFVQEGGFPEVTDVMERKMLPEPAMWVITNESKVDGASSMLYEDLLHTLAQQTGTDLYILPSSIHEVLAVSVNIGDPEELAQKVSEINMGQLTLEERLSNQVYHYDKDLRKLTLATDTPNKRLDGLAAEEPVIYEAKQSR